MCQPLVIVRLLVTTVRSIEASIAAPVPESPTDAWHLLVFFLLDAASNSD